MSTNIRCPECTQKLRVPETMAGKAFRCPSCKCILSAGALSSAMEDDPEGDEAEVPPRPRSIQKAPPSQAATAPMRSRPPHGEDLEEVSEPEEEEPIRERPARKRKPSRKKSSSGLIIGLVAGGLVLFLLVLGAGGGAIWYLLRGKTIPKSEWQTFSPPNSGCSVLMPGTPIPQSMNIMGIALKMYLVERKQENAQFALGIYEIPPHLLRPSLLEDVTNGSRAGALARMDPGSKVTSETAISLGNIPGREYQIEPPNRGTLIARMYLAKVGDAHRVYLVLAGGDYIRPNTGDAAHFFASFKLDPSATPVNFADAVKGGANPPPNFQPPPANPPPNIPRPNPGRRLPRMPRPPV